MQVVNATASSSSSERGSGDLCVRSEKNLLFTVPNMHAFWLDIGQGDLSFFNLIKIEF